MSTINWPLVDFHFLEALNDAVGVPFFQGLIFVSPAWQMRDIARRHYFRRWRAPPRVQAYEFKYTLLN